MAGTAYLCETIGVLESPFPDRRGCPRQAALAPAAEGTIRFVSRVAPGSLEGLSEYSHCWVLFMFSENADAFGDASQANRNATLKYGGEAAWSGGGAARERRKGRTWPSKVAAPRLGGGKTGVFATRSPHRPNPIGLSVCAVLEVDAASRALRIGGVDIVDGTPILDVKPYVPYDAVPDFGVPAWVVHGSGTTEHEPTEIDQADAPVRFEPAALEMLTSLANDPKAARAQLARAKGGKKLAKLVLRTYANRPEQLAACVLQVVAQDPRSVHQGRGGDFTDLRGEESFTLTIDGVEVSFVPSPNGTVVTCVRAFEPPPAVENKAQVEAAENVPAVKAASEAPANKKRMQPDSASGAAQGEAAAGLDSGCRAVLERWLGSASNATTPEQMEALIEHTKQLLSG